MTTTKKDKKLVVKRLTLTALTHVAGGQLPERISKLTNCAVTSCLTG